MCALILNGCGAKNSEMTEDIQKAAGYAEKNNFSMDSYSGEAALAEEPEVSGRARKRGVGKRRDGLRNRRENA